MLLPGIFVQNSIQTGSVVLARLIHKQTNKQTPSHLCNKHQHLLAIFLVFFIVEQVGTN